MTPTPGSRCGSPATAGRTSTRLRWCRSARPVPARPRCTMSARLCAASRRYRWSSCWCAPRSCVVVVRWRRSRPTTWGERVARAVERAGGRAGRPRRPAETLGEYAARLDALSGAGASTWSRLAASVEASAYGGHDPPPASQRALLDEARRTRVRGAGWGRCRRARRGRRVRCAGARGLRRTGVTRD